MAVQLAGGRLEAEVEGLALQFTKLFGELVVDIAAKRPALLGVRA